MTVPGPRPLPQSLSPPRLSLPRPRPVPRRCLALGFGAALALVLAAPSARSQDPRNPLEDVTTESYGNLLDVYVAFVAEQLQNLPGPGKSMRENAFGVLNAFWAGAATGIVALPAGGLALGTGVGIIVGAPEGGVGAIPGGVAGGAIGTGAGIIASLEALVGTAVLSAAGVAFIEKNFPQEAAAAGQGGGGSGSFQLAPDGAPRPFAPPVNAGAMESYFVALVQMLPPGLVTLARRWDKMPGLTDAEQAWLRAHEFAREPIQRLAYILANNRISANSLPAADVTMPFADWLRFPDNQQVEDWWVGAFGLIAAKMQLSKQGKLELQVPGALQAVGAPKEIELDVADVDFKVGGNGGAFDPYVRLRFVPGPAKLEWSTVSVVKSGEHKDRIQLKFEIDKGTRLGALKVTWKWNGPEQTVADIKPYLGKKFGGSIYFKVDGMALIPDGLTVGNMDVDLQLPKPLREAIDALKDAVADASKKATKELEKLFEKTVPWAGIWKKLEGAPGRSVERGLKRSPGQVGLASVDKVDDMEFKNGALRVKVRGKALARPNLPIGERDIAARWNDRAANAKAAAKEAAKAKAKAEAEKSKK